MQKRPKYGLFGDDEAFTRIEILRARGMIRQNTNNRIYDGQDLGVKYGDGTIIPLDDETAKKALKLDDEGFYRILDVTPIGRLPIVVI